MLSPCFGSAFFHITALILKFWHLAHLMMITSQISLFVWLFEAIPVDEAYFFLTLFDLAIGTDFTKAIVTVRHS